MVIRLTAKLKNSKKTGYSVRILFTGLVNADFTDWKLTVHIAINSAITPARIHTRISKSVISK
ncbi:hypothetical protein UNH65_22940 [Chitinophaga sp. 180180018-2]|nr:hypothetical protein [Chitinophaga sp. 212800010-3]